MSSGGGPKNLFLFKVLVVENWQLLRVVTEVTQLQNDVSGLLPLFLGHHFAGGLVVDDEDSPRARSLRRWPFLSRGILNPQELKLRCDLLSYLPLVFLVIPGSTKNCQQT